MLLGQIINLRRDPPVSGPEPLGQEQCRQVAAVVAELVSDWSVGLHQDILGNPTIVIVPQSLDDAAGPTLFVHREGATLHIEETRWGEYRKLDEYRLWADVLRAVRIRLIWEMPFPTTLTDQRC